MKLLTKIIGKAPSEMEPDELLELTKRNRARIRKEIKEYRKLKAAIREVEGPKRVGRPTKIKDMKKAAITKELKELSPDQLDNIIKFLREK